LGSKEKRRCRSDQSRKLKPTQIAEEDRDYFLERRYPAFGNLVPRDVASRAAKERCDAGFGIEANDTNEGVYLDFSLRLKAKENKQLMHQETTTQAKKKSSL
jgi:succinate dehydrogenase / fumarate reductase, flavoprotein subunit